MKNIDNTSKIKRIEESHKKMNTLIWVYNAMKRDISLLSPTQFSSRKSPEYNSLLERQKILNWDIQKELQLQKD